VIRYVVPAERSRVIREYLELWGKDLASRLEVLPCEELAGRRSLEPGTYVLAALDQMSAAAGRLVADMHRHLSGRDGFRFLNHPTATLRRFELLSELRRLGRNDFRAFRATGDLAELRFPVFLREERAHDGAISPLFHSLKEVEAGIGRALVTGYRLSDLLVIEFLDTADAGGTYRKYAAFVVGGRVIARSLASGRGWMLKFHGTDWTREVAEEELSYVAGNPHAAELAEIFRIAGVQYGRIDYAVKDGRIQTWEINLNPTVGRGLRPSSGSVPADLEPIRTEVKRTFYGRFREALEAVDLPSGGRPAVPVAFDPRAVGEISSHRPPRRRILGPLPRALRPARPLLEPLAAPVFRALGRMARESGARRDSAPCAEESEVR
jgi:hypothetical protein